MPPQDIYNMNPVLKMASVVSEMVGDAVTSWNKSQEFKETDVWYYDADGNIVDTDTGSILFPSGTVASVELVPDGVQKIDITKIMLKDAAGDYLGEFQLGPAPDPFPAGVDKEAAKAVAISKLNEAMKDENGKTAMDTVPDLVKDQIDDDKQEATYTAAPDIQKNAIAKEFVKGPLKASAKMKEAAGITARKQDGSRTSREYHEWKYCCILSNNYSLLRNLVTGQSINYEGVDPQDTAVGVEPASSTVPPYHAWVQYTDLRKACNLVKKIRRQRSKCGGLALLLDQGFADKDAAIKSDLEASAEWDTLRAALDATTDFAEL